MFAISTLLSDVLRRCRSFAALFRASFSRSRIADRLSRTQELRATPQAAAASPIATLAALTSTSSVDAAAVEERDWRAHFVSKLVGCGLEIGPLHEPLPRGGEATVTYVDRLSVAELRRHYPEVPAEKIVAPDIVDDAETLRLVPDGSYDFVSAAHVIEHMRNPIAALENWCRVLKPGGLLYLVVPDKRATFDRLREPTTLEHMLRDYYEPSRERDREHFLEYAVKVDGKKGVEALRGSKHLEDLDYSIHFHVFLPAGIAKLLKWFGENICPIETVEGPVMVSGSIEFHLLLRCYGFATSRSAVECSEMSRRAAAAVKAGKLVVRTDSPGIDRTNVEER